MDIKEKSEARGTLNRISFDAARKSAFFTLDDCSETFLANGGTLEQEAALALSQKGDSVWIKLDTLPPNEHVVRVTAFVNLDLPLKQE
jgi:hypothetical protein